MLYKDLSKKMQFKSDHDLLNFEKEEVDKNVNRVAFESFKRLKGVKFSKWFNQSNEDMFDQ